MCIAETIFVGVCYIQLRDVAPEVNGLLTFNWKPKFDTKELHRINDLLQ